MQNTQDANLQRTKYMTDAHRCTLRNAKYKIQRYKRWHTTCNKYKKYKHIHATTCGCGKCKTQPANLRSASYKIQNTEYKHANTTCTKHNIQIYEIQARGCNEQNASYKKNERATYKNTKCKTTT